jgi:methanogenic corrinoid protein MtbC1
MNGQLAEKLSALPAMPREAVEELECSLERLTSLAVERIAVQYRFRFPEQWQAQQGFVEDATREFGKLLSGVYRFGIFPVLAGEGAWYIATFAARGLGPDAFAGLVDSWIIAIRGTLKPPASDDLSGPLSILREDLPELVEIAASAAASRDPLEPGARSLLDRLFTGDFEGAERILHALTAAGRDTGEILDRVLMPCVREIGVRWEHNEIGVADEHGASEILRRLIARLGSRADKPAAGLRVVVACVPGDEHEIGPSALSAYLESLGWDVAYLGRSMPVSDLVRAVGERRPRVVFLSLSMIAFLPQAVEAASGIRRLDFPVKIVFGGREAGAASAVLLAHADAVVGSFREAHEAAVRLAGHDA